MIGVSGRRVLSSAVAEQLVAEIMSGKFRPGDRLPTERELAEQLCVNRSSIREALKRLEQLRLVHIQQGSGIRVLDPSEASLDVALDLAFRGGKLDEQRLMELLDLRDLLLAAALDAGIRRGRGGSNPDFADRLDQIATAPLSDREFLARLQDMQRELAAFTENQVLLAVLNTIRRSLDKPELPQALSLDRSRVVPSLHALAKALREDDCVGAGEELVKLLQQLRAGVMRAMSESGEAAAQHAD